MGSDKLFQKRKARGRDALKKRHHRRLPYPKVLIVCEGEKTEPNYFNELRDHYRLEAANVLVSGNCGSDPMSVYLAANDKYEIHENAGDAFDKVYCVIDRDSHDKVNYQRAIDAINRAKPKGVWHAVISVPCFEYWILLHFDYTTKPFMAAGARSRCQQLIRDLQKHLPNYSKGRTGLFKQLLGNLDTACANARNAAKHSNTSGTDNPTTSVHVLVEYLQTLARKKGK